MNVSLLERHEQLLARLWKAWSHTVRVIKIFALTTPNQYPALSRILAMLRYQRRFLATNNQTFLTKALDEYFIIRESWVKTSKKGDSTKVSFSGWAVGRAFESLNTISPGTRVRRIFRPDVWYLTRGQSGFFSGFEFVGSLDNVKELYIRMQQQGVIASIPSRKNELATLKLESLNPARSQRATHWYSSFALSPQTITQLIEYTSDVEMASIISEVYADIPQDFISADVDRSLLILQLIAKDGARQISGWKRLGISEPNWIHINQASGATPRTLTEKYCIAENVEVSNGGVILSGGCFLNWDLSQHPSLDFVAGNVNLVVGTMGNLGECFVKELPLGQEFREAILLGSRVDANWFHFLIETLPRLLVLDDVVPLEVPVLISARLPSTAIEAIKLLTARQIVPVETDAVTLVSKAYIAGPAIYHPDSQFMWDKESGQQVDSELLKKLRERIIRNVRFGLHPGKTYFERTSAHRGLLNPKSISKLSISKGYTVVNPSDLSFNQQVQLFHESRRILAVGGAVMANFLFANEDTTIILLVSNFIKGYRMPQLLGQISGSQIRVIAGYAFLGGIRKSYLHKIHSSFLINPLHLRREM